MIPIDRLEDLLATFKHRTIALVGDLFLDRYLHIAPGTSETSIETQLEAYQVDHVRNSPGALGTVMNNLAALGIGRLIPVTVIGDDGHGYDLVQALDRFPIDKTHILRRPDRLTPTYTKPLRLESGNNWQELNRLDIRTRHPLATAVTSELCQRIEDIWSEVDGFIVLDQIEESDWGVVNTTVRNELAQLTGDHDEKLVFIDSRAHVDQFSFGVLKGNGRELLKAAALENEGNVEEAVRILGNKTKKPVYCTLGDQGMCVGLPNGQVTQVAGCAVEGPVDIVGAGDSATAAIVAALTSSATAVEAAEIGNLVASITVQQLGTTGTASPEQVLTRRRRMG